MQLEGCDSITLQPSGSSSFAIGGDTRWSSKGLLLWGLREEPSELGRIGDENLPSQKEMANGKPHATGVSSECTRRLAGQPRTMSRKELGLRPDFDGGVMGH